MSRQYYYYSSIRKTIIQFLDIFKNIKIARHDSNGSVSGYIKVPIKFGLKEKCWYWLNERKDDEMLPIMSVVMDGVEYDSQRQTSKVRNVIKSKTISTAELSRFLNPVPYNLNFTVTLWSLHMVDVDQILEQILPYFLPNIFIRMNIPELDSTLDLKVMFNGCSPEVTDQMSDEEIRILKWNLTFTVHSYLFQPLQTTSLIRKVIDKFYVDKASWGHRFTESEYTSGADGHELESIFTKGIYPYYDEDDWAASTYYEIGDYVKPTTTNGYLYQVQSIELPGKSGTTEPTWPTNKGVPVIDNDIIWERYQKNETKRLTEFEVF